jgi:uncharacterized small protein (DUF1192 family)
MNSAQLSELLQSWTMSARDLSEALEEVKREVASNEISGRIYDLRNNIARLKADENQKFEDYLRARQNFYGQEQPY